MTDTIISNYCEQCCWAVSTVYPPIAYTGTGTGTGHAGVPPAVLVLTLNNGTGWASCLNGLTIYLFLGYVIVDPRFPNCVPWYAGFICSDGRQSGDVNRAACGCPPCSGLTVAGHDPCNGVTIETVGSCSTAYSGYNGYLRQVYARFYPLPVTPGTNEINAAGTGTVTGTLCQMVLELNMVWFYYGTGGGSPCNSVQNCKQDFFLLPTIDGTLTTDTPFPSSNVSYKNYNICMTGTCDPVYVYTSGTFSIKRPSLENVPLCTDHSATIQAAIND